jgi:hypothetical protein
MRALLLLLAGLTVLSIAPGNAANSKSTSAEASSVSCNTMGWPRFSAVPCRNVVHFTSYVDCANKVLAAGWNGNDVWWYCSNIDYKK